MYTIWEHYMRLKQQGNYSCTNLTVHVCCILGDDDGYGLKMVMTMMTWWWPQATARSQAVWPLWFSTKRSAPWPTRNSTHLRWHTVSLCNAMVIFWCCFELGKILLFSDWKWTPSVQFMVCRCEGNALCKIRVGKREAWPVPQKVQTRWTF